MKEFRASDGVQYSSTPPILTKPGVARMIVTSFCRDRINVMQSAEFLCIGHRGACGHEPENTLRSVRRALELGAHGVEIDVYFVDGEIIVIHDATLERTT